MKFSRHLNITYIIEEELTSETNSCPKSSTGWMSSNASRIPSLRKM
jgi:hypothetical protein